MANTAYNVDFSNGPGPLGNMWNVDWSNPGTIKLAGPSAMMGWATGTNEGTGYGTYEVRAKFSGGEPGAAVLLWPSDNKWPGPEIDFAEVTPDGSGRVYATVHWNEGGDAYDAYIYNGVYADGSWHTYNLRWEPGKLTFSVDGKQQHVVTNHVPVDAAHGGMNEVMGFLNKSNATSLEVDHASYTPLDGSSVPAPTPAATSSASVSASVGGNYPLLANGQVDWNAAAAVVNGTAKVAVSVDASVHVDWDALAATVALNHSVTGSWFV